MLIEYINAQYDAATGANDGDWIFLRLSISNTSTSTRPYDRFYIDGADGLIVEDYDKTVSRIESDRKPPFLILDYVNLRVDKPTVWDGISWSRGVPTENSEAIIDGNIEIGGGSSQIDNILCKTLLVTGSSNVNVYEGSNVYVSGDFTVDDGSTVFIKNGGSFACSDASTVKVDGTYVVERTANESTHNYTYWSSPVKTTVELALIATGSPKVYEYETANFNDADEDGEDDNKDDWQIATGDMVAGKGYIAKASNDDVATTQTAQFVLNGTTGINKGNIDYGIVLSGDASGDGDADLDDWNLVGNPYSSALDAIEFIMDNENIINGTLYFWTHGTAISGSGYYSVNDYAYYNVTGGTDPVTDPPVGTGTGSSGTIKSSAPTGKIASGQGFFIEAKSAGTLVFNSSMQLLSLNPSYNNDFFKKGSTIVEDELHVKDRFWLNINSDNSYNQILVGFLEGATNGIDNLYDGKKLDVGSPISFYSIADNHNLSIQGKPSFVGDETIVLGFKSEISNTTSYKISIDNIEGVFSKGTDILLRDNYSNKPPHNLNKSEYEFTVDKSGTYNDRFEIVFTSGTLANDLEDISSDISVYPNPTTNYFSVGLENVSKVLLYNTAGIKVFESIQQESYNISSLPKGVYLVKAITENNDVVTSKLVKN